MTIHWIDSLTLERRSDVLSCQRIIGTHSFDVLTECMISAMDSISIRSKVKSAITDGGKNFQKALRLNGTKDDPELEKVLELRTFIDNMGVNDTLDVVLNQLNNEKSLPCPANCGAHILSLVSTTDVKKNCEKQHPKYWKLQTGAFNKLTRLWSMQHYSSKFSDEVKSLIGNLFATACETRWFSMYDAVNDFLKKKENYPKQIAELFDNHQKKVKKSHGSTDVELPKLSKPEEAFLSEYIHVNSKTLQYWKNI